MKIYDKLSMRVSIIALLILMTISCDESKDEVDDMIDPLAHQLDSARRAESNVQVIPGYDEGGDDQILKDELMKTEVVPQNDLFMFFGNNSSYKRVDIRGTFSPNIWPSTGSVINGSRVIKGPDATYFNGKYYVIYATDRDTNNLLYPVVESNSSTSGNWSFRQFPFDNTLHAPSIIAQGSSKLWVAWTYYNKIYWATSTDGVNWSSTSSRSVPFGTSGNLDLAYVNGQVRAYYAANFRSEIYYSVLSGSSNNAYYAGGDGDLPTFENGVLYHTKNGDYIHKNNVQISTNAAFKTKSVFGVVKHNGQEVISYKDDNSSTIYVTTSSNGSSWTTPSAYSFNSYDGTAMYTSNTSGCAYSNLARCATVTASSTYPGYSAQKTIDGSRNTTVGPSYSWVNQHPNSGGRLPETLTYDLGSKKNFSRVVVYSSSGYVMSKYKIQYSNNKIFWFTAVSVSGNTSVSRTHNFSTKNARYVRIYAEEGPNNSQRIYARVNEFEIYQ